MAYDRDSFLAGLAVGRTLWRPHRDLGNVTPPVGWTADPEYLVYDANTWLCSMQDRYYDRTFYKTYDGKAIAVFATNRTESNYYGPILISPDASATLYSYPFAGASFSYMGLTWWCNAGYHLNNGVQYSTDLEVYDFESTNDIIRIMQAANVRVWGV